MDKKVLLSDRIEARFGWDAYPKQYSGGLIGGLMNRATTVDCDAGVLLCGKDEKPISTDLKECFLNYSNPNMCDSAMVHHGDNLTGLKEDDEVISIDLGRLPEEVEILILTMDLFKKPNKMSGGKIHNTFVRIINANSGEELSRNDFNHLGAGINLVVVGKLTRTTDRRWLFEPAEDTFAFTSISDFIKKL